MAESMQIRNAQMINEGERRSVNLFLEDGIIERIESPDHLRLADRVVDASNLILIPGAIDDQVHFREPGLTHKANIASESRAAVAGGITSFMEMPNTKPPALTVELLEDKYTIASKDSYANYSFFLGAGNDNLEELLSADYSEICGVKIFMGSSTGNLLVDDETALEQIFSQVPALIATHCEDDPMIAENLAKQKAVYGEDIPIELHPEIRSREACFASSSKAVALARKHGSRLHILHISSEEELDLFSPGDLENKHITAEACIHHIWFSEADYADKGTRIKWNPAVKKESDRRAIRQAVIDGRIDVVATDHAPHTIEEKSGNYVQAPSGGPLVQHALPMMFELCNDLVFTPELVVEKMCHAPARLFGVEKRGFIREGYFADLVLVDPRAPWEVSANNILYKCGWSPIEGDVLSHSVKMTIVNGIAVFENGKFVQGKGKRLKFSRR